MPMSFTCIVCGKVRTVPPSTYARGNKYCSHKCGGLGRMNKHGEGKKKCTACKKILPRTPEFFYKNRCTADKMTTECINCCRLLTRKESKFRQEFVNKLGNKCNHCGMVSMVKSFLEVDHINPVYFIDGKRRYFSREDKSNLQVLCPNCHKLKTIEDCKRIKESKLV